MQRMSTKLSVLAAPYEVVLTNGKRQLFTRLINICQDLKADQIKSVYDRHDKSFLDIATIFKSHRRKFINETQKPD